jgi:hypothetical protein
MSRRRDPEGVGAARTVRQQMRGLLLREELAFDTLRALLGLSVRDLEDELLHATQLQWRAPGRRRRAVSPAATRSATADRVISTHRADARVSQRAISTPRSACSR